MKIGVIQMCSVLDYKLNLATLAPFLREAKEAKVEAVFLPETFYSLSDGKTATPYLVEGENEHFKNISNLAKDHALYILGGSAATKLGDSIVNRNYNFDPEGKLIDFYDKRHLFSCDLGTKVVDERDLFSAGSEEKLIEVGAFKIGLSICFDLRFPELYSSYKRAGANMLSISSAFTIPTGIAHWHTLLRARAIENQCFVVAAAQWGKNNERVETYGHSLIIDPWGEVLADAHEGEKLIVAEIDLARVEKARRAIHLYI
ncbi:MAG: carbon-nitrogen hydrolase family protein [Deltaproteobacteria bacterium]|nr:MAG: carbon-nitrogen hydrolase family protein [Deltaproteobacteria bacterium]